MLFGVVIRILCYRTIGGSVALANVCYGKKRKKKSESDLFFDDLICIHLLLSKEKTQCN